MPSAIVRQIGHRVRAGDRQPRQGADDQPAERDGENEDEDVHSLGRGHRRRRVELATE